MRRIKLERTTLLLALVAVSAAFAWVAWPYVGAVFWAVVLAIVFEPLQRRMLSVARQRETLAALATLCVAVAGVGVPAALIGASLLRQAAGVYAEVASRRIDFGAYARRVVEGLPHWAHAALDRLGLEDFDAVQDRLAAGALAAGRFVATRLLGVGLDALGAAVGVGVMLYVLFFLLRDGASLAARIERVVPLADDDKRALLGTFTAVIRATVKGGVVMAAAQGALGGVVLGWLGVRNPLFWSVVFGLLSMVPAVGAGLLWAPIAVYFAATGEMWKAVVLTIFGTVVLTAVDNVLRPLLVGRDTDLPGHLILVSTLGGVATFGLNGVVIGPVIAAIFIATWELLAETPKE